MCYLNRCLGRYPEVTPHEFPTYSLLFVQVSPSMPRTQRERALSQNELLTDIEQSCTVSIFL